MEYSFKEIENYWRKHWKESGLYRTTEEPGKEKYYVLDMFPYPSGAGLHVGHPLGYIASDIVARFKRLKGFQVLHPMGYDSFGLPAEQYAIQTGQHPRLTTEKNIERYREQLDRIGFSYDWDREIKTSDPKYYRWTQWIFIQLFHSWYDQDVDKAKPITELISTFEKQGTKGIKAACDETVEFSAEDWKNYDNQEREKIVLNYRLAYLSEAWVNWCPALGTVLANDEVKDGVSERGGYPVERKQMPQWSLRITAYADRLLNDLDGIDWPESIKDAQRNWIGKSRGCSLRFRLSVTDQFIEVFTTRPDTIFGVSFISLAPENPLVVQIASAEQRAEVETYCQKSANRSERERQADVKKISGVFTGAYAIHPFNGTPVPVWVADYVLAGYGTGAVMGVPAHDQRDFLFAGHFGLEIKKVVEAPEGSGIGEGECYDEKAGKMINSDFLTGKEVKDAISTVIAEAEKRGLGQGRTNYRLRDAAFGRQRYWGEPIPVYYKEGVPYTLPENELPLELPEIDEYKPTESGEPPLARATNWLYQNQYPLETTTMPGWAGSSWYFLRYMDPSNKGAIAGKEAIQYWKEIDLYLGGAEHATGHLLYFRFWTKFLYDLGAIPIQEPAKKLVNQGMIQGVSAFVYRINGTRQFVSLGLKNSYDTTALHVDIAIAPDHKLDMDAFRQWREDFREATFITEDDGFYHCGMEVEKMSKSKWNVVNPDEIIEKYGADTLRMYEMFLGPLEQSKPWSTQGISGVHNFLRRFWRLCHVNDQFALDTAEPDAAELKILHRTLRKVEEDIERLSFNTCISSFMIALNELSDLKCRKRAIIEPLLVCLSPFAPHFCEELWSKLNSGTSIFKANWPNWEEKYLKEDGFDYPVSINGKTRFKIHLALDLPKEEVERQVLASDEIGKYLSASPKKIIVVPGRIVNVVI